jgi:hypothetical protein
VWQFVAVMAQTYLEGRVAGPVPGFPEAEPATEVG